MLKFRISAQVQVTAPTLDVAAKRVHNALSLVSRKRAKVGTLAIESPDQEERPVGLNDIRPMIWHKAHGCYLSKVSINFSTQKVRGAVTIDGKSKSLYFMMDDPNIEFRGFKR